MPFTAPPQDVATELSFGESAGPGIQRWVKPPKVRNFHVAIAEPLVW